MSGTSKASAEQREIELLSGIVQTFDQLDKLQMEWHRLDPHRPRLFDFHGIRDVYAVMLERAIRVRLDVREDA